MATRRGQQPQLDQVNYEIREYQEMKRHWSLIEDLRGGTRRMREAGERWLPREEAEGKKAYENRLKRSFLYEAYADTVDKVISKPFLRPIDVTGSLEESLAQIQTDVDRAGRNITAFGMEVMKAAIDYGLTHILVDYPTLPEGATLEDERRLGARPTFVHVTAPEVIGWRAEGPQGQRRLTQLRIREIRVEPVGNWAEAEVEYIRVYTPTTIQTYCRPEASDSFEPVGDPRRNTLGRIPLVTIYFNRTGFMTGLPALERLAWLNCEHWQSSSDQNNVLGTARFGFLFGSGFTEDEIKKGLTIGPKRATFSTNPDAKLGYVEHTGAAIQAGADHLRSVEQRMEVLGLQPFVQRTGVETATGKAIHEAKSESLVHVWTHRLEQGLNDCYRIAGEWIGERLPDDFKVSVFSDFGVAPNSDAHINTIKELYMGELLPPDVSLKELQRRGVLDETADIEVMADWVKANRGAMGRREDDQLSDGGE